MKRVPKAKSSASVPGEVDMTIKRDCDASVIQTVSNDAPSCTQLCSALLASVAELTRRKGTLDYDLDTSTIESTLCAVRIARLSCDEIAWDLQRVCPAAGIMSDSVCEALQQYYRLAATNEFEFPERQATWHKCHYSPDTGESSHIAVSDAGHADGL